MRYHLRFLALLVLVASACGDEPPTSQPDGGVETDGAGFDVTRDSARCPDAAPFDSGDDATAVAQYCEEGSGYLERCSEMLPECAATQLDKCLETFSVERAEFAAARATCGLPDSCGDPEPFETRLCVYRETEAVLPTPEQMTLAEALCTNCDPGPDCLAQFFFRPEPTNDGVITVAGAGLSYFHLNAALVDQIAAECVPASGAASCFPRFYECVEQRVLAAQPSEVREACRVPDGPGPTPGS